jgi:hypothetical protein
VSWRVEVAKGSKVSSALRNERPENVLATLISVLPWTALVPETFLCVLQESARVRFTF